MAVPTVNKPITLENTPETSIPAQETGTPEEAAVQSAADQQNGVAITQMSKQTEDISSAMPVSEQVTAADPAAGATAAADPAAGALGEAQCSGEIAANAEDGTTHDVPKTVVDGLQSLDAVVRDVNVNLETQNINPEKKEPVILLSKAIQSKGASKSDGPPLSTCHLSGWFLIYK